jgi:2-haloacid dehalogenase
VQPAVVFDAMGTLFDLEPLRPRVEAAGAPPAALEAWFERILHSGASLTLIEDFRPFSPHAEPRRAATLEEAARLVTAAVAV